MVKPWDVTVIGDYLDFKNGLNKGKEYFGYGTPIVNYTDVYKKRGLKKSDLNGRVSLSKEEIRRFDVRKGDVFFTRTSETPDEVGMSSVMLDDVEDCVFSGFVLRGRPKNDMFVPEYCKYCFSTEAIRNAIISGCTYTTRALTNGKQLSAIEIPVPPRPEQEAIVAALSDVDELISNLEKLIAKKKAIKQGAMQELLTGKRRLPGFSGEWETIRFSETNIEISKGQTITQKNIQSGNVPVIAGGKTPAYYCNRANRTGKNITISASGASAGFVNIYFGDIFASDCSTIGENEHYSIDYVYYILLNMQTTIYASQTGGAQPHVHPKDIYDLLINYTFDVEEQRAIATILCDMDIEIDNLEQDLSKYKKIKSGMMSELLTSRIRLV